MPENHHLQHSKTAPLLGDSSHSLARSRTSPLGGSAQHDGSADKTRPQPRLSHAKTVGAGGFLRSGTIASELGAEHEVHDVSVAEELQKEEQAIERLRQRLLYTFETGEGAFAALDLNGHGMLSFEELKDSLADWDIDVKAITGGMTLKRIFSILDIDGSGSLSINELLDCVPWRLEDEGVLILRQKLRTLYGSREKVLVSLDSNGDGKISLDELRTSMKAHAESEHYTGVDEMLGGIDLARVFNILDYDFSGELSLAELMDCDPRREAAIRDECISKLRRSLISFFGTPEEIMSRLDANMNGKLSYGEFKDGLDRCRFDYKQVLGDKSLLWVFKVMDVNNTGDLPIHDLLEANSSWLQMKAAEARRQRLMRRKMRAKTTKRKALEDDEEGIPSCDVGELTPALKMISEFNLQGADGVPTPKGSKSRSSDDTKKLDMSHRYIGEKGALFLANSLLEPRFAQLKTLQLRANYIGTKASMWVTCACEKLAGLRILGLSWNHIDDHAAPRLAHLITTTKTLKELDLSFNRIRMDGAETFAKALKHKGLKLEILDLRFNAIDKRGVTRLRAAARKVVEVRLDGNPGSDALNESPVIAPRLTGGEVLPKILDVVVTGWPRESTSDGSQNKKGFSKHVTRNSPGSDGSFSPHNWPAATRLAKKPVGGFVDCCWNSKTLVEERCSTPFSIRARRFFLASEE